jgi:HD-like signal output (HDOD) protein/CheY-like chemotaxis protein
MSSPTASYCCDRRPADPSLAGRAPLLFNPEPPPVKSRILFVDDEPSMLRLLQMGMRSMAKEWEMEFASDGEAALALIRQKKFDAVVTDMRMPGMNGAQLLNQVLRLHPQTIRIVLSGYSDLREVTNCVGVTHQFLEKPCSLDSLKSCLRRVFAVKSRLAGERLGQLAAGLKHLPTLPELYLEITDALQSPNASAQGIAEIAGKDPALAAKLLQLSNSAFFGFSRTVFSVTEAVQLLGVGIIQSLTLAVPLFSAFSRQRCPNFPIDQVWSHSIRTGRLGHWILDAKLHDAFLAEQSFCAGLLHDIGKVILAEGLPDEYSAVLRESQTTGTPLPEIEQRHFQATHAEVGAYLLALWGLPIPLVEAVACHHHPRRCGKGEICLAGVVHIADALQHSQAPDSGMVAGPVDADYLKQVQLDDQFEAWRAELAGVNG